MKLAQVGAGLAVSVIALYFAMRDVHWPEVREAIGEADYLLVALAVCLLMVVLLLRAVRWRLLFEPDASPRIGNLFGALNVGYLINNLVPLQVGELGRAYVISALEGVSATRSLSTVVVERILDIFTLLLLLIFVALFIDIPDGAVLPAALLGLGISGATVLLVLACLRQDALMALIDRLLLIAPARTRPKLREMVTSALVGFAILTRPAAAARLLGFSFVNWLLAAGVVYLGTRAFDLGLGFDAAVLLIIATSFGFLVPSSPGGFGVYHAIAIGALTSVFDVDRNLAVSYALVIHMVFYLPPVFIGAAFLARHRELWRGASLLQKLRELRGGELVPNEV
jgi:uncharacterized protein (TIRG00374 family)